VVATTQFPNPAATPPTPTSATFNAGSSAIIAAQAVGTSQGIFFGSITSTAGSLWTVSINWGDSINTAQPVGWVLAGADTNTFGGGGQYAYSTQGVYSPTRTWTNVQNSAITATSSVSVTTYLPLVIPGPTQTVTHGVSSPINCGFFADPTGWTNPPGGPWSYTIVWGDSSANTTLSAITYASGMWNTYTPGVPATYPTHTYTSAGSYTVSVTVENTGNSLTSAAATFSVTAT
jgi:hypothetical protein